MATEVTRTFLEENGFLVFTYAYTRVPVDIPSFQLKTEIGLGVVDNVLTVDSYI